MGRLWGHWWGGERDCGSTGTSAGDTGCLHAGGQHEAWHGKSTAVDREADGKGE